MRVTFTLNTRNADDSVTSRGTHDFTIANAFHHKCSQEGTDGWVTVSLEFDPLIKSALDDLGRLLYYANSRNDGKWAWQGFKGTDGKESQGVYGYAHLTVRAILREEFASIRPLADWVDLAVSQWYDHWEMGCCASVGDDITLGVERALIALVEA